MPEEEEEEEEEDEGGGGGGGGGGGMYPRRNYDALTLAVTSKVSVHKC
jgi:hypothetical protein